MTCYTWRVPLVRILVLALALTHMVGLADLVLADACGEACRDDGCASDCAPDVPCHCHCPSAMPAITVAQAVEKIRTPEPAEPSFDEQDIHASPDPREILHVPKLRVV
jgi:hypothetical protein